MNCRSKKAQSYVEEQINALHLASCNYEYYSGELVKFELRMQTLLHVGLLTCSEYLILMDKFGIRSN